MHFLTLTTLGLSLLSAISGASVLPHGSRSPRDHKAMAARKAASVNEAPVARDYALETFNEALEKRDGKVKVMRKRQGGKTCRVRVQTVATGTATATATYSDSASSSSTDSSQPTSSVVGAAAAVILPVSTTQAWTQTDAGNWGGSSSSSSSTSTSATSTTTHAPATTPPPTNTGLLNAWSDQCGQCDSSPEHPNGSQNWLACGLTGGGWNPPHVAAKDLISIADPSTHPEVFGNCLQYKDIFDDAAAQYKIPTALLMAIGSQESGCDRNAVGQRGEQGIMQIAQPGCTQSDCKEPWYNIHRGAAILVDEKLGGDLNGNIIEALGAYNGWFRGMTASGAWGPQGQKASYLDDMFNKWMQGKSAY